MFHSILILFSNLKTSQIIMICYFVIKYSPKIYLFFTSTVLCFIMVCSIQLLERNHKFAAFFWIYKRFFYTQVRKIYINCIKIAITPTYMYFYIKIRHVDRLVHYYPNYQISWSCDIFRYSYATKNIYNNFTPLHFSFCKDL